MQNDIIERLAEKAAWFSVQMEKEAVISWGGGRYLLGNPEKFPMGLEAGYSHALGLIPHPYVGARFGPRDVGLRVAPPQLGGLGFDTRGEPGFSWSYPRSLYGALWDKARGNKRPTDDDDAEDEKKPKEDKGKKKQASARRNSRDIIEELAIKSADAISAGTEAGLSAIPRPTLGQPGPPGAARNAVIQRALGPLAGDPTRQSYEFNRLVNRIENGQEQPPSGPTATEQEIVSPPAALPGQGRSALQVLLDRPVLPAALLGAGALGLAGYGAGRLHQSTRDEEEKKKRRARGQ